MTIKTGLAKKQLRLLRVAAVLNSKTRKKFSDKYYFAKTYKASDFFIFISEKHLMGTGLSPW